MKIDQMELCNFRGFQKQKFEFSEKINLFVGINGSGKSSVLDAMAISLSWLVNRIQRKNVQGKYIPALSLRNDEDQGYIDIDVVHRDTEYRWFLTKTAKGKIASLKPSYDGASKLAEIFQQEYNQEETLLVIAYYPIDRTVKIAVPNTSDQYSISDLEVYENALNVKANYRSLFDWFRTQDDILNEKSRSRSYWAQQNRPWIQKKVKEILRLLENGIISKNEGNVDEEIEYFSRRLLNDKLVYEEPRFLFSELANLIHILRKQSDHNPERIFDAFGALFREISILDHHFSEGFGDKEKFLTRTLPSVFRIFCETYVQETSEDLKPFLWESFCLAILLNLWWLSDRSRRAIERLFLQSQSLASMEAGNALTEEMNQFFDSLNAIIQNDLQTQKQIHRNEGKELQVVRKAIETFMPGYENLQVKRTPRPHMVLSKQEHIFNLDQLSDGEKNLIALVGDIARRLTIANPNRDNPLEGEGVVLIDEIDLHLHPSWQRIIIPNLLKVFPNCQFFISTHSPQVISNMEPKDIFLLTYTDQGIEATRPQESYGMSIDRVVELLMDDYSRPDESREKLERLFELIERAKFEEAKNLVYSLKQNMPSDPDIMRAEMLIRMGERNK